MLKALASQGRAGLRREVLLAGLVWLAAISSANSAKAQSAGDQASDSPPADQVWIAPSSGADSGWYPEAIEVRRGRITALDAEQLRMVPAGGGPEVTVAAERVLWVRPGQRSEQERAALSDFRNRRYAESLRPLIEVVGSRPPVWRQQWLLMAAAQAAWRGSRPTVALELVRQLDQRPVPPLVLAWLPVAWGSARPSAADRTVAAENLSDPSPTVRLVAASWLLSSPDRQRAKRVLEELTTGSDRGRVARLAEAVLWRAALPADAIESAPHWERKIEAMPLVLQVGPAIALIEKLQAAGAAGGVAERWRWSLELTPPHPHPDLQLITEATD